MSGREFDNQHLVSQAILRQWTGGTPKRLEVFDRESGLIDLLTTGEACAIDNFIRDDPSKAERTWGRHETHLGDLYGSLTEERFFAAPRALNAARTMLAVHATRSHTARDISALATRFAKERAAQELVAKYPDELIAHIQRRSLLLVPITPLVLLAEARLAVERNSEQLVPGGAFFRDRLFAHLQKARRLMKAQPGLEVFVPANPDLEFVIGDDPVVIPSAARDGRFGPLQGVGWFQAGTFLMPFTPRHVIAVGPTDIWRRVDDDVVRWVNLQQLRQSRRHLVTRPGSGWAQWAAEQVQAAGGSIA